MKIIYTLLILLITNTVFAQKTITGKIQASDGTALAGASILIKDTNKGAIADSNGVFKINISNKATLVFQFVGFQKQEMILQENEQNVSPKLNPEIRALNEVVVKGSRGRIISCGYCQCPVMYSRETIQLQPYPNPANGEVWLKPLLAISGNMQPEDFCKTKAIDEEENEDEWLTEEKDAWKRFAERTQAQSYLETRQQLVNEVFNEAQSVTLVNMAGQKFEPNYRFESNGDMKLDLQGFPSGIYVVAITAPRYTSAIPILGKLLIR